MPDAKSAGGSQEALPSVDPRYDACVSLGARASVDALCQTLEDSWRFGHPVAIEEQLAGREGLARRLALRELLAVEVESRQRRGQTPKPEDYLARFPQDADIIDLVFVEADGR